MKDRLIWPLVFALFIIISFWFFDISQPAAAQVGTSTAFLLDGFDDKINRILKETASSGSLVSSKSVRTIQLEVDALRQHFAGQLDRSWDDLDHDDRTLLKEVDSKLEALSRNIESGGNMADQPILDVEQTLQNIPILKNVATLRVVRGASQYYKPGGSYAIALHGNIFAQGAGTPDILMAGHRVEGKFHTSPPSDATLNIPVEFLNAEFSDHELRYVNVTVKQKVPDVRVWFPEWRGKFVTADFKFTLELFPKYPAEYRLTEQDQGAIVDDTRTEVQIGREMVIPGCGDSGCNSYYNVCTDLPPGAQPIKAVDFVDSFSGWGAFETSWITSTGICARYHQHSHNVTRVVRFSVQYHPVAQGIVPHNIDLLPVASDPLKSSLTQEDLRDAEMAKPVSAKNIDATHSNGEALDRPGVLKFDRDYEAHFSDSMKSFALVVRFFTGEQVVLRKIENSERIRASSINPGFARFTLKAPW